MSRSMEITHIEYHPIGSEGTAVRCRALGVDESGDSYMLDGTKFATRIEPQQADRVRSELLELPESITADESFEVVAFGPTYISAVTTLSEVRSAGHQTMRAVAALPSQTFGVRVFVGTSDDCHLLLKELADGIIAAFDSECRAGRVQSPMMLLIWRIMARDALVSPTDRLVRGLHLFAERGDNDTVERLLLDATLFNELDTVSLQRALANYRLETRAPSNARANEASDDYLALNAKVDLLAARMNDLTVAPALPHTPSILYIKAHQTRTLNSAALMRLALDGLTTERPAEPRRSWTTPGHLWLTQELNEGVRHD